MRFLLTLIFCLMVCLPAFSKYESGSDDAASIVLYGKNGSNLVPIKVDTDGSIYTSGNFEGDVSVGGDLTVGGDVDVDGALYANGGAEIIPDLAIYGVVGVGIGTLNPASALDVNGTITLGGDAKGNIRWVTTGTCDGTSFGTNNGYDLCGVANP